MCQPLPQCSAGMLKKNFTKGDLVEYDFAVGLVLETDPRHRGHHHNDDYEVHKVLFCDGIEWINTKFLHEVGPVLRVPKEDKPEKIDGKT